jgi:hypothetical protein
VVVILNIDNSFYCKSNNDVKIGYNVAEYSLGSDYLINSARTKVHVIEGPKVDDYLQEFPVMLSPGHYVMRGTQGPGTKMITRELVIEQDLKLALTIENDLISVHALTDGTDRFIQQHIDSTK